MAGLVAIEHLTLDGVIQGPADAGFEKTRDTSCASRGEKSPVITIADAVTLPA